MRDDRGAADDDVPLRRGYAGRREHAVARIPQRPALGLWNERLGIMFHGNTITHLDSPSHIYVIKE